MYSVQPPPDRTPGSDETIETDTEQHAFWYPDAEDGDILRQLPEVHARNGAVYSADGRETSPNTGEFGPLDHPVKYVNLHGAPQAFGSSDASAPYTNVPSGAAGGAPPAVEEA